jgi:flagellar assembly protein FliH
MASAAIKMVGNTVESMVRKFDFGARFDEPPPPRAAAPESPKYGEAELSAAREAGRLDGMVQGRSEAEASLAAHVAATLEKACAAVGDLIADRERLQQELAADSVRTVMAVLERAMPELARRNALTEIEGLIRTCLGELYDEPRVVIRAADAIIDALHENVDRIATACGFTGKIALLGDPAMAFTDCRVEWADGGAERSFEATWRAIEAAIDRNLGPDPHVPATASSQL